MSDGGDLDARHVEVFALPPGVTPSETGLDFSSAAHLTYPEWEALGGRLGHLHSGIQWWLGDWFAFGEKFFSTSDMYAQALEATGRSVGGLYNLKWVAEKVRPEVRRADLSWSHHREVAKLPPEKQAGWLARAADGQWSVDLLRSSIRDDADLTTWRGPEAVGLSAGTHVEIVAGVAERDDADGEQPDQAVAGRTFLEGAAVLKGIYDHLEEGLYAFSDLVASADWLVSWEMVERITEILDEWETEIAAARDLLGSDEEESE